MISPTLFAIFRDRKFIQCGLCKQSRTKDDLLSCDGYLVCPDCLRLIREGGFVLPPIEQGPKLPASRNTYIQIRDLLILLCFLFLVFLCVRVVARKEREHPYNPAKGFAKLQLSLGLTNRSTRTLQPLPATSLMHPDFSSPPIIRLAAPPVNSER